MNDLFGEEVSLWQKLEKVSREILQNANYSEIRTPLLEDTALFARGIGDENQVVKKEMYTFRDKGEESVTLRPEGTAGVVRAYMEHSFAAKEEISKLYYLGPMFRYERPQKGRFRQFHQIGAEILGVDSPFADAEITVLVDRIAKAVGVKDYEVCINSLGTFSERAPYLEELKTYFSKFTKELCEDCQKRFHTNILRIFDCKEKHCGTLCEDAPILLDRLGKDSKKNFEGYQEALSLSQVRFKWDERLVRGLDYYEKNTFEFVSDKLGAQSAFAGGGRYNHLVEELGGKPTPGVGFSIGCERLILLMQEFSSNENLTRKGVYFAALCEEGLKISWEWRQALRDQGIFTDGNFEPKSLKSLMRKADKSLARYVVLIGEDELKTQKVVCKDLEGGTQEEIEFSKVIPTLIP